MQKYPIGIQDFEGLRKSDYVYVDKTIYIHQLISSGKNYFLSRPRRFGKSLFLSTLKYLFQGRKELFTGLFIEDKIAWEARPVIHLDFTEIDIVRDFEKSIRLTLEDYYEFFNIEIIEDLPLKTLFKNLILALPEKPVILVDEYDKPILQFIGVNQEKAEENRAIMRELYSILKPLEGNIHFLFITGITRFSKTSLFSDMNHLFDITIEKSLACICGYTEAELYYNFGERIQYIANEKNITEDALKAEIKLWYNGYKWHQKADSVYNPFSILQFMSSGSGDFQNYWFNSGLPTFLIHTLNQNGDYDFESVDVDELALSNFNIDNLDSITLMFQAGYLTIKDRKEDLYTLVYPNMEVKKALLTTILNDKSKEDSALPHIYKLREYFENKDFEEIQYCLDGLFANIPNQIFDIKSEHYYHSIILIAFQLLGCIADAEVSTSRGRIDAVVKTKNYIYVLEFKVKKNAEIALEQIRENSYTKKYNLDDREVICIGVTFENKEIKQFLVG